MSYGSALDNARVCLLIDDIGDVHIIRNSF